MIWLSPTYPSPNADNDYDVSDHYSVSSDYGTIEDMKALIRECDENGIRVIMDLVVNHTSDEHLWFIDAKNQKTASTAIIIFGEMKRKIIHLTIWLLHSENVHGNTPRKQANIICIYLIKAT